MRRMRLLGRGFTLVELLVVIIIIAVLAAVIVPLFASSGLRSKEAALKADLKIKREAVQRFHADTGLYPLALSDLASVTPPAKGLDETGSKKKINPAFWRGSYIEKITLDPVSGNDFQYSTTAPTVGEITSSATGTATDGTLYSSW